MSDALTPLVDAIADRLMERMAERERSPAPEQARVSEKAAARVRDEIELWKPYKAGEVADFIGLSRDRVYHIDETLLRPTYMDPSGTSKRYIGINVLMYVTGLPPVDVQAVDERVRADFLAKAEHPAAVRSIGAGKRKVL